MAVLVGLAHRSLVDVYTEARPLRHRQKTVDRRQNLLVGAVVEEAVAPGGGVNAQADFLDGMVGRAGSDLQARAERERTQWAVRSDCDVVRLGHRGNLAHFQNAAGMAEVGLYDVHGALLEEGLELPTRVEPLAERDGRGRVRCDL